MGLKRGASSDSDDPDAKRQKKGKKKSSALPFKKRVMDAARGSASSSHSWSGSGSGGGGGGGGDDDGSGYGGGGSESEEDFDDGFGPDLIGDDDDRRRLANMTEVEREATLAQRAERRETLRDRWEIKKNLRDLKREKARRSKPGSRYRASTDDARGRALDEMTRKRENARTRGTASPAGAAAGAAAAADQAARRASHEPSSVAQYLDTRAAGSAAGPPAAPPLTLTDLNSVKLSRRRLEKWLYQPYLATMVVGSFVRVGLGLGSKGGGSGSRYLVYEVVGMKERQKVYNVGDNPTDKVLEVRHGDSHKNVEMKYVSNSDFTMPEFDDWVQAMRRAHIELPSSEDLAEKCASLRKRATDAPTPDEVTAMLAEKRRLRPQPIKVAHEIERVRRLTDAAREAHARLANEETAEHLAALEAELTALEDQLQSHAESAIDKRARSINAINKKNRDRNFNDIITMERSQKTSKDDLDPFARRSTRPTILWNTKKKSKKGDDGDDGGDGTTSTDAAATAEAASATAATTDNVPKDSAGPKIVRTMSVADELAGKHGEVSLDDFDLDLDDLMSDTKAIDAPMPVKKSRSKRK